MQWPLYRHLPDSELWDLIAYLKHGLKPVSNKIPENDESSDHWVSFYTPDRIGVYPFPVFPAGNEEFHLIEIGRRWRIANCPGQVSG